MTIVVLLILGLALGSFVNALVWRLREQEKQTGKNNKKLSITKGRSMCPNCRHELAAKDLIPVFSWLRLGGKCRYCQKRISAQYPLVELSTAALFIASYVWWPRALTGAEVVSFTIWLLLLVGFVALIVYDTRWKLLPDKIMIPLAVLAAIYAVIEISTAYNIPAAFFNTVLAVTIGGGIFYGLYQVSKGRWIGGGDVKLGWLLGLIVATPARSLLLIFLASALGSLISIPLLASHKLKRNSTVPFGPFLILGAIIVQLFGHSILHWYSRTFLTFA